MIMTPGCHCCLAKAPSLLLISVTYIILCSVTLYGTCGMYVQTAPDTMLMQTQVVRANAKARGRSRPGVSPLPSPYVMIHIARMAVTAAT